MAPIQEPPYTLPLPFHASASTTPLTLLTQGAEALVFRTSYLTPTNHCILKYRPSKPYRHPILDKRLTRARILAEARVLVRCRRMGVAVPGVIAMDWEAGWLMLEYIPGMTIRACLDQFLHTLHHDAETTSTSTSTTTVEGAGELWDLMRRVGRAVGKMHHVGVVHGDLTTSNLMLRTPSPTTSTSTTSSLSPSSIPISPSTTPATADILTQQTPQQNSPLHTQTAAIENLQGDIVLIDFGLAAQSVQDEDKAVDLYVLERAFSATHPAAEPLFKEVLSAYGDSYKGAKVVLKRLDEVRLRGRKKSMLG